MTVLVSNPGEIKCEIGIIAYSAVMCLNSIAGLSHKLFFKNETYISVKGLYDNVILKLSHITIYFDFKTYLSIMDRYGISEVLL